MQLSRSVLYSKDAQTPLRQAGENVSKWTRTDRLGRKNQLTGQLMRSSDEWQKFSRRRLVKLDYGGDKSNEWWRITQISDRRSEKVSLTLRPRYVDLEDTLAYVEAGGEKMPRVVVTGLSPSNALSRILNDLPSPDLYAPGDVASAFQGEKVYVWGEGVSYWKLLHDVADEEKGGVDGRIRFEWDGSQYLVHLEEPGGGTQTTITFSSLTEGVRGKDLSYTIDDQNYFSAVAPIGGQQNERITIAEARWAVASSSYDSTADETTLTTQDVPIWADDVLEGRLVDDGTSTYQVLSASRPDQVVVAGDASGATSFRFRTINGSDLTRLTDDEAERKVGKATQAKTFGQVSAWENLLRRPGVTTNAEDRTGWSTQGTVQTFTTIFDIQSTQHGAASLKVTADKAGSDPQNGIATDPVSWAEAKFGRFVSATVQLRVISGSVGVELEDNSSTRFPARGSDDEIIGAADTIRGYQLGGFEPADGDLKLRIFAREDGTEFHVDAVAMTSSTGAQPYSSLMGPRALWDRAARHLRKEGGIQPPGMNVTTFTLSDVEGFRGTLASGDFVRVVTEAGLRLNPITTQVRQVEEELSIGKEASEQKVTIGTRKKSFVDRVKEPEPEPTPPQGTP